MFLCIIMVTVCVAMDAEDTYQIAVSTVKLQLKGKLVLTFIDCWLSFRWCRSYSLFRQLPDLH